VDLIYKHPSGGELWQGGVHDVHELAARIAPRITVVVLAAQEKPLILPEHFEVIRAPLIDVSDMSSEAIALTAGIANMAATEVANHLRRGNHVLSSCAAGRNRSGLISALTLMKVADYQPNEAVAIVRRHRQHADGPALSNPVFVEILFALRGMVGSMTTWKRWK